MGVRLPQSSLPHVEEAAGDGAGPGGQAGEGGDQAEGEHDAQQGLPSTSHLSRLPSHIHSTMADYLGPCGSVLCLC